MFDQAAGHLAKLKYKINHHKYVHLRMGPEAWSYTVQCMSIGYGVFWPLSITESQCDRIQCCCLTSSDPLEQGSSKGSKRTVLSLQWAYRTGCVNHLNLIIKNCLINLCIMTEVGRRLTFLTNWKGSCRRVIHPYLPEFSFNSYHPKSCTLQPNWLWSISNHCDMWFHFSSGTVTWLTPSFPSGLSVQTSSLLNSLPGWI